MTPRGLAVLAVGAIATVLVACGESRDDEVAERLAADLRDDTAFADDISADEARCVGDELVADLGADAAAALGPEPGDDETLALGRLEPAEVAAIGTAMEACVADLRSIVVDLVAAGILAEPDDAFPVTPTQAGCIGEEVADELAFERLLAVGLGVDASGGFDALDDDEARAFAAAFTGCVDVRSILLDQVRANGAGAEVVDCLDERITDAAIEELFVESFRGGTADTETVFAPAIDACT